jgi:hypothetical protein
MKFNGISVALVGVIVILSGYLYLQNRSLEKKLVKEDKACSQQLAVLKKEYEKRINTQIAELDELQVIDRRSEKRVNASRLDGMASYGHQVRAIRNKYEFLLETANITTDDKKLLDQLLVKREKLNGMVSQLDLDSVDAYMQDLTYKLVGIEEYIKDLLKDPVDYRRYSYLKERSL